MKKRVRSKVSVASKGSRTADDSGLVTKFGLFTFPNGDTYEGEYIIYGQRLSLARQGDTLRNRVLRGSEIYSSRCHKLMIFLRVWTFLGKNQIPTECRM